MWCCRSAGEVERRQMAASVSTSRRHEPDFRRDRPAGHSQLTASSGKTRSRPLAVIGSARKSPRHRPVSKYSCQRPTAARAGSRSKAVAQILAPLMIGIRRRAYVRSLTKRTGIHDPQLPMTESAWASAMRRKSAGRLRTFSENQSHKFGCRSAVGRVRRQSTQTRPSDFAKAGLSSGQIPL